MRNPFLSGRTACAFCHRFLTTHCPPLITCALTLAPLQQHSPDSPLWCPLVKATSCWTYPYNTWSAQRPTLVVWQELPSAVTSKAARFTNHIISPGHVRLTHLSVHECWVSLTVCQAKSGFHALAFEPAFSPTVSSHPPCTPTQFLRMCRNIYLESMRSLFASPISRS